MENILNTDPKCLAERIDPKSGIPVETQLINSKCLDKKSTALLERAVAANSPNPETQDPKLEEFVNEAERRFQAVKSHEQIADYFERLRSDFPQYADKIKLAAAIYEDGKGTIYDQEWINGTIGGQGVPSEVCWSCVVMADVTGIFRGGPAGAIVSSAIRLVFELIKDLLIG